MLDRPRSRIFVWLAAYLVAGLMALALPRVDGLVPWYPPLAVGIGILAAGGVRWWPLVLGMEIAGGVIATGPDARSVVAYALPITVEAAVAGALLRRLRLRFLRGEDAVLLALVAVATGALGAALAVATASIAGLPMADPADFWFLWALCDVTTITTLVPLPLLVAMRAEGTLRVPPHAHLRLEIGVILAVGVMVVLAKALGSPVGPDPWGVFRILWIVPVAWMAVRYERFLAVLLVALMAAVAFVVLPWSTPAVALPAVIEIQLNLVALGTLGLLVASTLAGRREASSRLAETLTALEESEQRYTQVFAAGSAIQFLIDRDTMRFLDVSESAARFYGFSRDQMRSMAIPDLDPEPVAVIRTRIEERPIHPTVVVRHRTAGGRIRLMEIIASPVVLDGRMVDHVIARDVTDEVAARVEVARLAAAVESSAESIVTTDLDGRITGWNAAAEHLYGFERDQVLGRDVDELLGPLGTHEGELGAMAREGRSVRLGHVLRRGADGEPIPVDLTVSPIILDGEVIGMSRISHDLRHLLREEERLRRSEALLADAAEIGRMGSWEMDPLTGRATWSEELRRITGVPMGEPVNAGSLAALAHADDRARVEMALAGSGGAPLAFRLAARDGVERSVVASWRQVPGSDGDPGRVVGVLRDVTEERALEDQLRQAQRLESIGMLAGGVAHDFNNLLTAIAGFTDLARTMVATGGSPDEDLAQVDAAVERGRALTSQLLTFGRRSVVRPRPVDVGRAITALVPMLRRLLGEDITIVTELEPDTVAIVDPWQLDQLVVNLAINARDAMPSGGQLRLAAGRTAPGASTGPDGVPPVAPPVWIEVEDDGQGIPDGLLERIFEPFFTTKERGRGTGLGLATVQGIFAGADGRIDVRSQVGEGTVFRVELPAIAGHRPAEPPRPRAEAPTGEELVLLVEDEDLVRRVAQRVLERAGFRVVSAANVPDALAVADRGRPDVLVTDIVLPGVGDGIALAEELHARWPDLPILLVTGYTERVPPSWATLLTKPYETVELVAGVRRLLDDAPGAAGAGRTPVTTA